MHVKNEEKRFELADGAFKDLYSLSSTPAFVYARLTIIPGLLLLSAGLSVKAVTAAPKGTSKHTHVHRLVAAAPGIKSTTNKQRTASPGGAPISQTASE